MKPLLKLLALLLLCGCSRQYPSLQSLYTDYRAARAIKGERYEDALEIYFRLLENDPDRAGTHSNVGVLLNMTQRPEEAAKSLLYARRLAEQQKDSAALFTVNFNLGTYYGQLRKVPEALASYQAALELRPDSLETKTNIELLIQQQQQQKQGEQGQPDQNNPSQGQNRPPPDGSPPPDAGNDKQPDDGRQKKDDKKESSAKYKPRPYQGDQLSEGDVKKILGELRNQEQKIRANFDKKEKGNSKGNEKDW